MSYDKTNDRFKLQKRINEKVKSYSLPKRYNEICRKIKDKVFHRKPLSEWFKILDGEPIFILAYKPYELDWWEVEEIFEKYCKEKAKELSPKEVAKMALYAYRVLTEMGNPNGTELANWPWTEFGKYLEDKIWIFPLLLVLNYDFPIKAR